MKYKIKEYPDYDEYKLIDLYPVEKIHFRRGNSYTNFFAEDFAIWQNYFCEEYIPPEEKNILLFHCCSWSKPYDFSYIIKPIKDICDKYKNIHRCILSNVGVVPYEYQMNPTFCSYDFPPVYDTTDLNISDINGLRKKILQVSYDRIYRYLSCHKEHYVKVLTLSLPIQYSMSHMVGLVCRELGITFENVVNKELYIKYKDNNYKDKSEVFIEKDILRKLDNVLNMNCKKYNG